MASPSDKFRARVETGATYGSPSAAPKKKLYPFSQEVKKHIKDFRGDYKRHKMVLDLPTVFAGRVWTRRKWLIGSSWVTSFLLLKSQAVVEVRDRSIDCEADIDWKRVKFYVHPLSTITAWLSPAAKSKHHFGFTCTFDFAGGVVESENCTETEAEAVAWVELLVAYSTPPTLKDFEVLSPLGKGGTADVFLVCRYDTEKLYALKVIAKKQRARELMAQRQMIERERVILEQTQSPFTDRVRFAFQTKDYWFLVMDLAQGGDLIDHMKRQPHCRFDEDAARFYAAQLALGISDLHGLNVIHRDLKPENVLVDEKGHVRICDFGLARQLDGDSDKAFTFCGTGRYLAPEVVQLGRGGREGYTATVDWWGLGQLTFVMLFAHAPFFEKQKGFEQVLQNIVEKEVRFPKSAEQLSPECVDFVSRLLTKDVLRRLCGAAVMKHAWFRDVDWAAMREKRSPLPASVVLPRSVTIDRSPQPQPAQSPQPQSSDSPAPPLSPTSSSPLRPSAEVHTRTSSEDGRILRMHPAFVQAMNTPPVSAVLSSDTARMLNAPSHVLGFEFTDLTEISSTPSCSSFSDTSLRRSNS